MAKLCTNCGTQLADDDLFCLNCGIKQPEPKIEEEPVVKQPSLEQKKEELISMEGNIDFQKINRKLKVKNSQRKPVTVSLMILLIAFVLVVLTFTEGSPLYGVFAVTLIGIFAAVTGLTVALVFRSRAKKMDTLISGENVIASWQLSYKQKSDYVDFLFKNEKSKNKAILGITTILIVLVFGGFILFIDEGKGAMFLVMLALIALVAFFALVMPTYYRSKNKNSDGMVLLGQKYAYINGFFHNWDFPLSGIQKVKIIEKPFHGLFIQYYYYDRTFKNTEELNIPAPAELDLKSVTVRLKTK
ncbi:zinc-ribbon domain-containing protein [Maribellus maritimus]|uniref:zinc-ribbon domain-containing protein n=1 Tax=Maribellus maritimus TaxID=2870838 RepID=UPI001EEC0A3E|nr:zinc-ribbon domain-containing protein [Maribellus maritimus]MCG6187308.1 zinc ribbon domain-containing protein [Maribellus maritimus]